MAEITLYARPTARGIAVSSAGLARALPRRRRAAATFGAGTDRFPVNGARLREWLSATGAEEVELILTPRRLLVVARAPGFCAVARFTVATALEQASPASVAFAARRPGLRGAPSVGIAPRGEAQQLSLF
jgi:hypothetical protein